jgi:hypothetical protein
MGKWVWSHREHTTPSSAISCCSITIAPSLQMFHFMLLLAIDANSSSTWLALRLRLVDVLSSCRCNASRLILYIRFPSVDVCFLLFSSAYVLLYHMWHASNQIIVCFHVSFVPYTMKATLCYYFVLKFIKLCLRWLTATWWVHMYYMWHA